MVISDIRRRILEEPESDIDYVKRQVSQLEFIYPASLYYDNSRFHIRGYNGGDTYPKKRFAMLLPKEKVKKPITWWGPSGGYYLYPNESSLSYIHIPKSIKQVRFKHNAPSSWAMSADIFKGDLLPKYLMSSGWKSGGQWYSFDLSSMNQDVWLVLGGRYGNNSIVPFTTPEQMKLLYNIEIELN